MRKLLIATFNRGKLAEFLALLKDLSFEFLTPFDINSEIIKKIKIKEVGKTFEENAIIKAKKFGQMTGFLTLADDSGLCVDYLGGRPGIKTHRYQEGSDKIRFEQLLKEMKGVTQEKRKAKFVSVIALFDPLQEKVKISKGECQGSIAFEARGNYGFGFDPIFIPKGFNKHFAELTLEEKNRISHRALALKKLRKFLLKLAINKFN